MTTTVTGVALVVIGHLRATLSQLVEPDLDGRIGIGLSEGQGHTRKIHLAQLGVIGRAFEGEVDGDGGVHSTCCILLELVGSGIHVSNTPPVRSHRD